ncbi:MAG: hypothetical protein NTY91_00860 [Euryarchaeota archaeon]|nr:hypothetical protein [Euryarchaeota archaeon]
MKKQLILIGTLAVLVCVGLSGCNQISNLFLSEADKFVGTWNTDGIWMNVPTVLEFFSNGTVTAKVELGTIVFTITDGNWSIQDKTLTMEIGDLISQTTYSYQFSSDDKILTLTDSESNDSFILRKQ